MKKLIFTVLFLAIGNLYANDVSFFGVDINRNDNTININQNSTSTYDTSYEFQLGYMSNDRRHYISYAKLLDKNDIKYENVLYNYDLFLKRYKRATPYIGIHAGVGILKYNNQHQDTFDYGLKLGVLQDLTYSSHIDFGLKYSNANDVYIGDLKVNEVKSLYLGITIGFEDLLY